MSARTAPSRRILISGVVLAQPMGGVRRHNVELLPRVARLAEADGVRLALLVGRDGLPFELDARIERLASDVPAQPVWKRALSEARALRRVLGEARARGDEFALVHTAHLPAPRKLSVPYTLTLHDLRRLGDAHTPAVKRWLGARAVGAAARGARTVLTVGESVRVELLARFELEPARVVVVPNAADHFEPLARAEARDAPLVHIGHVEPRKNLEVVVRALALDPTLPRFVAHGAAKDGEDRRLLELARSLGVANRVTFAGAFDERELATLYATAGAIVLPSKLEGFGIAAIEAQRAFAPLAIARIAALVEVAGAETPSFAPDDAAECARALRAALNVERASLASARERVARFTWQRSAEIWWSAWRAILAER
ncbi:MAG: glycosyltransferase [Planctomycetes bacterium]|nr:glycosyltransferase [Planctomycetota bacterium]